MWTVIYVTPKETAANKIRQQLVSEGFLVKIRLSNALKQYEILIPEGELEEVREVLTSILP